jgi:hypothetical protein
LRQAAMRGQWLALVDGTDSFDPSVVDNATLERLLWLRCRNAAEAMRVMDLVLRDRNLPLVALDLALNPFKELRKVQSSVWFRFQRLIEATATAVLVTAPMAMSGCAAARLQMPTRLGLEALDWTGTEAISRMTFVREQAEGAEMLKC